LAAVLLPQAAGAASRSQPSPQALSGPEGFHHKGTIGLLHESLADSVTNTAEWLDTFFISDRTEQEANKSHVLLRTDSIWREGDNFKQEIDGRVRLVLPGLEDRFHVVVSDIRETGLDETPAGEMDRTLAEDEDEEAQDEPNLVLEYLAEITRRRDLRFEAGGTLDGFLPVLFGGARYRNLFFEEEPWLARFIQRLRWYTNDGWEVGSRLELDRRLGERVLGRLQFGADWYQIREGFFFQAGPVVFHQLSERRAMRYEALASWQTQPTHRLENVRLGVRYRQRIWRKWLFLEVSPGVTFPREEDYDITPGIRLRFDVYFSERHT
jgi:hypothetical protein